MKYSIVVAVYNVEKYLKFCVESILNQTYKDIELILVDDGSTDQSGRICDMYEMKNQNVRVIHKKNGGLSDARNAGLEEARGEYIWFIDGDDFIVDECKLSALNHYVDGHDVLSFNYIRYFDDTKKFEDKNTEKNYTNSDLEQMIKNNVLNSSSCNKIFKLTMLRENSIVFPYGRATEDTAFCANVISATKDFLYVSIYAYAYRQRENSITKTVSKDKYMDVLSLFKELQMKFENSDNKYLIYSFIAYQYICALPFIYRINDRELLKKAESEKELLKYDICTKVKVSHIVANILGFKSMLFIIDKYLQYVKSK